MNHSGGRSGKNMLFHILKKDLKRKKTMNVILLLFIMMAATFLAASVNNLMVITGAVDHFLELANTPDLLTIAVSPEKESSIEKFLKESPDVDEYEVTEMYNLTDKDIRVKTCAKEPERQKFEKDSFLALGALPRNFLKVFGLDGAPVILKPGELAISRLQAEKNNLQLGDVLEIACGENTKQFTVAALVKDAVFGTQMMGFKRLLICQEDYDALTEGENIYYTFVYSINADDMESFQKEFKKNNFQTVGEVDRSLVKMCYIFDMLIAAILIVVSVCLIVISFLILRFTIVFTLQEDYKEIGIMKAIGVKERGIKGIYLVKYAAISLLGSFIGLCISFPFQKLLLTGTAANIVMENGDENILINAACAAFIVLIVLLFCYGSTSKVKKFSAIQAIRNGGSGERYQAKNLLRLHRRKMLPAFLYMACNDVTSSIRRYAVLAVIFCIGTLEILLPLTALHTLKDDSIVRSFSFQESTLYMDTGRLESYMVEDSEEKLLEDIAKMKEILAGHGLESRIWVEAGYMIPCYSNDPEQTYKYYTMQVVGTETEDYDVVSGRMPELPNEVMVTEITAREMGVEIGDSVYYQYPDRTEEFVITGIYQSMMNMGNGLRVSHTADLEYQYISSFMSVQAEIESDLSKEQLKKQVQEIFPDYRVVGGMEYMDTMIGGIVEQIDVLQGFIIGIVLLINVLITVLMMKTLITRERGEIAMLKSLGFSDRTLKGWQSMRILMILVFAILLGIGLSRILAPVTIKPIFAMMGGTSMKLTVRPLETYIICPLILLAGTGIAAYLCAGAVKKVDLKEINTLE